MDGWRLGLGICRDTLVPAHDEATAALGIDVYVAGVVHHLDEDSETSLRAERIARARSVWVAIASHAGSTGAGFGRTAGRSGIWDPSGAEITRAGVDPGSMPWRSSSTRTGARRPATSAGADAASTRKRNRAVRGEIAA